MRRTRLIRFVLAASLVLGTGASAAQERTVEPIEENIQQARIAAQAIGHTIEKTNAPQLEVESAAINIHLPSGEPYAAYLISAYEPRSGLFWWTFQGAGRFDPEDRIANLPSDLKLFVSEREIIGVELGTAPPALWIVRSSRTFDSAARGKEDAIKAVGEQALRIQQGTARWMRSVSLANALPRDFYHDPNESRPLLELDVTGLRPDGNGWTVELKGREGRRAEVSLGPLFTLEDAREIEAPRAP